VTDVSLTSAPQPNLSPVKTDRETCASCGATMAGDQRYCLECGQRRGEPRLPFMDAVVLMEAVKAARQPPAPPKPPKRKRSGISPNAALITGIGTLLLALGIGVLIGRSGTHEVAQTAAAPQVITVGSAGGEATAGGSQSKGATTGGGNASKAKSKKQKQAALKESEAHPAAEEVLKPAGNVDLPPSTVKPGDKCQSGEAGCENGEFTGNFFE
jgi:hypothetical protein